MTGSTVEIEISRGSLTDDLQDGDYYVGGSTNIYLEINYSPSGLLGYIKVTHTPRVTKIGSIKHKGQQQEGLEALKNCTYVIVYFSKSDYHYSKPLLIQFDGKGGYYYAGSSNLWAKDDNPNSIGLLKALDKQNCGQRSAHAVDISQNARQYSCPSCSNKDITIQSSDEKNNYKKVTHSLSGDGTIDTIRSGTHTITPSLGLESVTVFWYPPTDPKPLLIYFSSDSAWIKRVSKKTNDWTPAEEDSLPFNDDDSSKILPLLKKINGDKEGLTPGDIATYVAEGLASAGMSGLGFWKGPAALRGIVSLLRTLI